LKVFRSIKLRNARQSRIRTLFTGQAAFADPLPVNPPAIQERNNYSASHAKCSAEIYDGSSYLWSRWVQVQNSGWLLGEIKTLKLIPVLVDSGFSWENTVYRVSRVKCSNSPVERSCWKEKCTCIADPK
jgi:hypothetical protein